MRTWGIQSAKARENALILSPIVNSSNHRERARVLRLSLILVCFTLFCIGYRVCFWQDVPYAWQSSTMNGYNFHGRVHTKVKPARMVVLPATEVNSGFCRTLFTLLINGYPAPTIVSICT